MLTEPKLSSPLQLSSVSYLKATVPLFPFTEPELHHVRWQGGNAFEKLFFKNAFVSFKHVPGGSIWTYGLIEVHQESSLQSGGPLSMEFLAFRG